MTGEIGSGLLVLLGVEKDDDEQKANRLCERVLGYRIFSDAEGKMNLNVQQAGGSVLVVSQFTLAADTERGMRPGFSKGGDAGPGGSPVRLFRRTLPPTGNEHADRTLRCGYAGFTG